MDDKFQQRYLLHQKHKQAQFFSPYGEQKPILPLNMKNKYISLLINRRSQRIFNSKPIDNKEFDHLLKCLVESPSSCNRQAISIKTITERNEKEILTGILVGGVGWCHRADKILLLFANIEAYKEKLKYMPFLDAGVIVMNCYLACESIGLGCCFINPNIRPENKNIFKKKFGSKLFCGALTIGHYDKKSLYSTKISKFEILL